ncbi:MAG: GerW family sporulation protein [Lachnospiraceae bacterium]|nr:GerW family sporulation protein [Lachnospiraceae bacterium]
MADNSNNITCVMDSLVKNAEHLVGSKTVIGDPVKLGDTTIIPLVDVSFGLAAGAGETRNGKNKNGGAGGMNAKLSPSAVLLIQDGHARILNVKDNSTVSKIADLIPELVDKFKARKAVTVDEEEAKEAAFPEADAGDDSGKDA